MAIKKKEVFVNLTKTQDNIMTDVLEAFKSWFAGFFYYFFK
ncbi:MAG: hypothetical protein Q7K42_05105 [Candidatus Diapherotrites archaeon]|nr:hypothetical protein [Candidatus Diapherotrites archaeon]